MKPASPRVSVVVAAYNARAFIGAAIASVQAQTETDWELLVVDDCSTDETPQIVADLARQDTRIRLLRAATNGGPGAARNIGLAAAHGEWIAILDADDRFEPDRLRQLLALGERFNTEIVTDNLLECGEGHAGEPEAMLPPGLVAEPRLMPAHEYILGNIGKRGGLRFSYGFLKLMVRRDFLAQHGLRYNDGRFAEDFLFACTCLLHGAQIAITPAPLYLYTIRAGSLTVSSAPADIELLISDYRALIAGPAGASHPELHAAMTRHLAAIEKAFIWTAFADALKARDARGVALAVTKDWRITAHIVGQVAVAMPRFLRKATKRIVQNRRKAERA